VEIVPEMVDKNTWDKVINYIAMSDEQPPYLLMDKEMIREKISQIGRTIRNAQGLLCGQGKSGHRGLPHLAELGLGFEIASEGELRILAQIGVSADRIITSNPIKDISISGRGGAVWSNLFRF